MVLTISSDLARTIAQLASDYGFPSPEAYLRSLIDMPSRTREHDNLSDEEFEGLLDELSSETDLRSLPADFSRADIYADHD